MIKIYFSNYSKKLKYSDFCEYLRLLPQELEYKITRYRRWEDQHASLYGKLLLMKALEESGLEADLLNLKYTTYGRPYLENTPDFNISHSGFFAVCAFSLQGKIGVDIEEMKPITICDFKEEFSEEEWNKIAGSNNSNHSFYYYWTAKEAIIKADGRGISLPLKTINIEGNETKLDKTRWFTKRIAIDDDYMLQIATNKVVDVEINLVEVPF